MEIYELNLMRKKKCESKDETTNELQNISMDFQLKLTAANLRSFNMCTI